MATNDAEPAPEWFRRWSAELERVHHRIFDRVELLAERQRQQAQRAADTYLALSQYVNTRGEERARETARYGELLSVALEAREAGERAYGAAAEAYAHAAPAIAQPHPRWKRIGLFLGSLAAAAAAIYKLVEGVLEALH